MERVVEMTRPLATGVVTNEELTGEGVECGTVTLNTEG